MTKHSKIALAPLREIGWAKWDPIGVGGPRHDWPADEYDAYLLEAAGQLWNGQSDQKVADYLVEVETDHMGLQAVPGIQQRALDVVKAMREYVETLRS